MNNFSKALDFCENYEQKVEEAVKYLKSKLNNFKPEFGIVLGSGLGDLADSIKEAKVIPYNEIPNFPITTVAGHDGKLIIGMLEGIPVICFKGRKHYYEVADQPLNTGLLQIVFPVHVLASLGVKNYFVTNAAGALNSKYAIGDIMIIKSHFSLIPNPLLGRHLNFLRVDGKKTFRFQPMNNAYDLELRKLLLKASGKYRSNVQEGVYVALTGPTYETEAECIAFRKGFQADAVGMSTAPEVIVARNRGMNVVGFSCITNVIAEDGTNATNHEEVKVILESKEVKERLLIIVKEFFKLYRES